MLRRLLPAVALALAPFALGESAAPARNLGAVWFVGDSITQSNADGDPAGSPRKSLYDLLTAAGYAFTFTGHHTANIDGLPVTGKTPATDLYRYHSGISGSVVGDNVGGRTGMTANLPRFWKSGRLAGVKPSIILVMLGTNDVNSAIDAENAPARLKTFLEKIHALPDAGKPLVLVATIPPDHANPGAERRVEAYNAALPKIVETLRAGGENVRTVDVFAPLNADFAKFMRPDKLHPNAAGNAIIAKAWLDAIACYAPAK